jgi:hypothetical protein
LHWLPTGHTQQSLTRPIFLHFRRAAAFWYLVIPMRDQPIADRHRASRRSFGISRYANTATSYHVGSTGNLLTQSLHLLVCPQLACSGTRRPDASQVLRWEYHVSSVSMLPSCLSLSPRHFRPGSRKRLSLTRTYHVPASLNECRRVALTLATQDTTLSCSTVAGKPSVGQIRRMRGWNFEKFQGPRNATELKAIIARSRTACRHQVFIYPLSSPFSLLVYHLTHEHEENILAAKYCAVLADGEIASLQFVAN